MQGLLYKRVITKTMCVAAPHVRKGIESGVTVAFHTGDETVHSLQTLDFLILAVSLIKSFHS